MSFSADKVPVLKGAFSQRRFSTSKEPSENGELGSFLFRFHPNSTSASFDLPRTGI
jgi:hypothetical protein